MGRAPNPGGGQRVSAHVVPKGKPFPDADEEERTTIESQWEEEASTTVEQGDVADKIRSLGNAEPVPVRRNNITNVTNTGAGALDEPTVDDQRASSALAALGPARLVITQGNDIGHEFEMRPGKSYTIGRAIDNDVVLTDIAVSRKHFDLRHEGGAWVIVDRGSGNGTVVNGNLEDNPFMLAHGDTIEIGNTVFRFDHPESGARQAPEQLDDMDEEELSTVAGKPVRTEPAELETPPNRGHVARERPKTLPPPTPLRHQSPSQPPPGMMPYGQPQPASTLPLPQMANRAPVLGPQQPTMLGDQRLQGQIQQQLHQQQMHQPLPGVMPTTIPGQGAPPRAMFGGYPQATEIPPHSIHQLMIQSQNPRGDASTAHVPPIPFDSMLPPVQPRYSSPQLTKRTKMVIGATGGALLVAIATVAIIKSGSGSAKASAAKTTTAAVGSAAGSGKPTVESIKLDAKQPAITPIAVGSGSAMGSASGSAMGSAATKTIAATGTTATTGTTGTGATAATGATAGTTGSAATTGSTKTDGKTDKTAKVDKTRSNKTSHERTQTASHDRTPTERTQTERTQTAQQTEARQPTETRPKDSSSSQKRVAVADTSEARNKADNLYRSKKFAEASSILSSAAKNAEEPDAGKLRYLANVYNELGKAYALGMAPAAKASDAFTNLRYAANFDRAAGGALDGDIQGRLAEIAPKAAVAFMAAKDYKSAHTAVLTAESLGKNDSNVAAVKRNLESRASELYEQAKNEIASNPSSAKEKLHRITDMVDAKSPTYQKAQQLLKS